MALEIQPPHLVDVLLARAERTPGVVAYEMVDGASRVTTLNLPELGVDSPRAAEGPAILEDALGLDVPLAAVLTAPTPIGIADALLQRWRADAVTEVAVWNRIRALVGEAAARDSGPSLGRWRHAR
jgi:hypothetical protein